MGVKGFLKFLINEFPDCFIKNKQACPLSNTLFIDLCQLSFRSSELVEKKFKSTDNNEHMDFFLSNFIKRVKDTILTVNPTDTIFAFFDGPNPAIKFQRQRERWFKRQHIDNYVIDATEYKLSSMNTNKDELLISKLNEFFDNITHNCKYLRANRILFSTFYAPGEAEHKYFDVFRDFKQKQFWKQNQIHSIYTTDNDLILLALQFLDEHFFIYRDQNTIIDISILRDLFLLNIFQNQDLHPNLNRLSAAKNLLSHVPIDLQQQVINDIIALSFIIGNDYLPPIPDFSDIFSFSKLLNSYKKINEKYFSTVISNNSTCEKIPFLRLIENDCICVSSLQKLIQECLHRKNKNEDDHKNEVPKLYDDNIIKDNRNSEEEKLINNINLDTSDNINESNTDNSNNDDNNNNNNDNNYDKELIENTFSKNDDFNKDKKSINKFNSDANSNENNDDIESGENHNSEIKSKSYEETFIQEASQQMLRVFNFTWIYYTKGCPSWSYYYPFKYSPKLRQAINLMKQEDLQVFKTEGYNEKIEPMLKTFILHPVESKENLPWCLYKLKIPPSEISHYWPLGAKNADDVPLFDLKIMKLFYKEGMKHIQSEDLKYNRCDPQYFTFINKNNRNTRRYNQPHCPKP